MANIHIQTHPDSIGGDQKIHIAILEQFYLGITGTRRERAHHHSRAAPLPAHQLGQPIYLCSRKRHQCRAARQAAGFFMPGIGQAREAFAIDKLARRIELLQNRPHRVRTQKQRFMAATRMKQPVGKDMTALFIAA